MLGKAMRIYRERGLKALVKSAASLARRKLGGTGLDSLILTPYACLEFKSTSSWRDALDYVLSEKTVAKMIRPMQVREEITALLSLLESVKPRTILEIGTARGGTLFLFSRIASDDALIISVDLPGGLFGGGYPYLKTFLYRCFARTKQKIVLLREDSHSEETLSKVRKHLNGRGVDSLFIDGDHSYEGVKRDFEMYSPLVKKGGIIAFHDIVPGPPENVGGCSSILAGSKAEIQAC
ncbi:O-methyltransferase-like protein [Desulfurococcus mucosus DSM 2162]|uniref:O-methyltransferase-like protein n=2 Tax=Desulfurococcus mucosus TaxID=2275 RepID=E8R8C7_DESM0|nr:O-methyltransferase-like protein [Desulfurococcus mucosus DSM 2162]